MTTVTRRDRPMLGELFDRVADDIEDADGILLVRVGPTGEESPAVRRVPVTVTTPAVEPAAEGEPPAAAAT